MLNYIKLTLNFLCYDFDKYAWLISVSCLALEVLAFLIAVVIFAVKKRNGDATYFLCSSIALLLISLYFSLEDYNLEQALFKTTKSVIVYCLTFAILIVIFYMIARRVSTKKVKKDKIVFDSEILPQSNAVKYFNQKDVFSGYLDVGYIKSLILDLKQKDLTSEDYEKIEEFEIYLLRFIARQPNGEERVVLSKYLSMLIKKISLYAS
ncbi:MAG: hypothetical protein E7358_00255 [Clostridiales bacterium]|nr:hypothetical protein [Clostridiales bacterium]